MNEELTLDGVRYISAKRAADITQYSKDYVGQLCREGKILANRIGRNWYVAEKSILRHKNENGTDLSTCASHADRSACNAQADIPLTSNIRQDDNIRLANSLNQEEEENDITPSQPKKIVYNEPLATYQSDDRPVLPHLNRDVIEAVETSSKEDEGNNVRIKITDSPTKRIPTKYVDKMPVRTGAFLEMAVVASIFVAVSLSLLMTNSGYVQIAWTGLNEISSASASDAFNQSAKFVNETVDDAIYDYLYASLLNN